MIVQLFPVMMFCLKLQNVCFKLSCFNFLYFSESEHFLISVCISKLKYCNDYFLVCYNNTFRCIDFIGLNTKIVMID
jgi:hypothetical protein